jgi:hypothetical protein
VEIGTKLLDDNLNAISSSVNAFTAEIFGKCAAPSRQNFELPLILQLIRVGY